MESDESIAVMRRDSASAVHVPLRIREIVEECLSADKWERSLANASTLSTENSILMKELDKTKQLLVEYQKSNSTLSPAKNVSVSICFSISNCIAMLWLFNVMCIGSFW